MLIVIQITIIDQDKKNHETNFRKTESKIKAIQKKRQVQQHKLLSSVKVGDTIKVQSVSCLIVHIANMHFSVLSTRGGCCILKAE